MAKTCGDSGTAKPLQHAGKALRITSQALGSKKVIVQNISNATSATGVDFNEKQT